MKTRTVTICAMVICLSLIAPANAFGQAGIDDSQMRESAAARIMKAHDIEIDWRNTSLLEITDIEARLNAVARIKRDHEITFDWRKTSLLELTDAEARLNAARRIKSNHGVAFDWDKTSLLQLTNAEARVKTAKRIESKTGKSVDWKEHSLENLLHMEAGLNQASTNPGTVILSFEVLFPPANQQAMGLHKLTEPEKEELRKHVETLLIVTAQAGAKPIFIDRHTFQTEVRDGDIELFDYTGNAVVYIATDQDMTIYLWSGKPCAYLDDESIYGFNGKHIGWFQSGVVYDPEGRVVAAIAEKFRTPVNITPLKGLKELRPLKSLKELKSLKPIFSKEWSRTPAEVLFLGGNTAAHAQSMQKLLSVADQKRSVAHSKAYLGVGGGHWIKKNVDSGTYIILEDGSLWEIDPFDKIDAMLWLPISNITVIESSSGSPSYDYMLINTDDGEKAHAKYMGKQ